LLAAGIYPERLEITTIATLGAIMGGLALQDIKSPALVLEVGREQTSSYILSATGMDLARPIPHGLNSMIPVAQKEMGLKDEEAATKLLFSNTFDFTGMGPSLLKRLLKELQSSIGFYEVQTGQSIGYTYCSLLPGSFSWLPSTLATTLGVAPLEFDIAAWCKARDISFAPSVVEAGIQPSWLGVLGLMANHHPLSVRNEAK
jgi:Tfp pilus assembly PilM family ATPase